MLFYKIEGRLISPNFDELSNREDLSAWKDLVKAKVQILNEKSKHKIFIAHMGHGEFIAAAICAEKDSWRYAIENVLAAIGAECEDLICEEVKIKTMNALAELASSRGYGEYNIRPLLEDLEIGDLVRNSEIKYSEHIIDESYGKKRFIEEATRMLCTGTLVPEIKRIYEPVKNEASGHPVHYLIQSDDREVAEKITNILLRALYENKRIKSRRYCNVVIKYERQFFGASGYNDDVYKAIYKSCKNTAVVVDMALELPDAGDIALGEMSVVQKVCATTLKNRNDALTVLILPRAAERIKNVMRDNLDTMTFVEITEDDVDVKIARKFLRDKARFGGAQPDNALYRDARDKEKTYSVSDLNKSFNDWYDNRLKTKCYTQYANFESSSRLAQKVTKPKGDGYHELDKMIGLTEAKTVITEAVDYFKAQQMFKKKGIAEGRPSMHMVFSGSPGTAKTSAARLFARIMKENGLLSVGNLVEVGRSDLVGMYVGWTAQIVKQKFKEAKGSVLFIDEAYSLVEDRRGLYGDEAINTIVQEMENMREDIVVIFAGYSDKMEEFLESNPGLRSRIAFHVPFADYDTEELLQILDLMAEKQKVNIDEVVHEKLRPILEKAMREEDFGNGRYIRNLYEKARMKQASRLVKMNPDKVTKELVARLVADDFEPIEAKKKKAQTIGFTS